MNPTKKHQVTSGSLIHVHVHLYISTALVKIPASKSYEGILCMGKLKLSTD